MHPFFASLMIGQEQLNNEHYIQQEKPTEIHIQPQYNELTELVKERIKPVETSTLKEIKPLKQVPTPKPKPAQTRPTAVSRQASTGGNSYSAGYCTAFVKDSLPWVPNGLGNANTWASRAPSFGLRVSSTPAVGTVAQTSSGSLGHVAVVTGVSGSSVTVIEQNFKGRYIVSTRTVPASSFVYIYP